ncbi:MAG: hypothetical protein P4M12_03125 [Gammaproteobacteria bacterium]|nr:hypothetical protein [Gammaproteobacteria bacterium]
MSAVELLCKSMGVNPKKLTKEESIIVEAELSIHVWENLKKYFKINYYKNYFRVMKFSVDKENEVLDVNCLRLLINDILLSEEYTLEGIAYYTHLPEEVICDVASGKNLEPSATLSRKIIKLHRIVRPKLYEEIMKKIIMEEYLLPIEKAGLFLIIEIFGVMVLENIKQSPHQTNFQLNTSAYQRRHRLIKLLDHLTTHCVA